MQRTCTGAGEGETAVRGPGSEWLFRTKRSLWHNGNRKELFPSLTDGPQEPLPTGWDENPNTKKPVEERALPTQKQGSSIPALGSIVMATSRMSAEEQ